MKKMFVGIFALVLCFSSFKGMAQDEKLVKFAAMYNSNVDLINLVALKTRNMSENERTTYLEECKILFQSKSTSSDKGSIDEEFKNQVVEKLGLESYEAFSTLVNQWISNTKDFVKAANLENVNIDENQWNQIIIDNLNACRIIRVPIKPMQLEQAPIDNDGSGSDDNSGPCRDKAGYFACGAVAIGGGNVCASNCVGLFPCVPCMITCAGACLIVQTAAIYICHRQFCK